MARPLHLAWALVLGACFTGGFLAGQPCTADADCGPNLRCEAGVCGGPSGQASSSSSATTEAPTTSATSTSTGPATTGDPTTTSTTSTTSTTDASSSGDGTTGPACGIGRCKDLDLLLIIDNSPSMNPKTDILVSAMLAFGTYVSPIFQDSCSIHLGVITTDASPHNPPECQRLGALVQNGSDGDPCSFAEGKPYATLPDLDNPSKLACVLGVGSDGDTDERPVDALLSIFQEDLNSGCNAGFYRPDAFLAVVIATDEDDDNNDAQGHDGSLSFASNLWYSVLTNFKKNGVDDLYLVGLLGDPDPNMTSCPWMPAVGLDGLGTESSPVLRGFIESFPPEHHAVGSLCRAPDPMVFAPLMQEILADLQASCGAV